MIVVLIYTLPDHFQNIITPYLNPTPYEITLHYIKFTIQCTIKQQKIMMTTSISQDKQNQPSDFNLTHQYRPVHQGRAFRLDLGHNNGPFLSKDMMHSNQKSTYLLAAKQVLQSHKSMASMMMSLSKEQQNQSRLIKNSCKVQSWFSKCEFIEEEIRYIGDELKKLAVEENKLKKEVKISFARLLQDNKELNQSFLPLFRNLLKCIREHNNEEKNLFQEKKRDLEELHNFRNNYLDQLVNCERRIIKIQEFLGVDQQSNADL